MNCPKCNGETKVINSRAAGNMIRRRRECECGFRFTTLEAYVKEPEKKETSKKRGKYNTSGFIYVKYDSKPPYLPVAFADSVPELAEMLEISPNVIYSSISHKLPTYKKVRIYEGD